MRIAVSTCGCFLLLLVATSPLQAQEGRQYALVVGVKDYEPSQNLPSLPFAESDAADLAEVLEEAGYQVILLSQAFADAQEESRDRRRFQPNAIRIRDELAGILGTPNLGPDDAVLIAFAGHGVKFSHRDDPDTPDDEGENDAFYFCPADADIREVEHAEDVTEGKNLISIDEIYESLDECTAGIRFLLVDACRNDPNRTSTARSPSSEILPELPPPPGGIAAFFSCSPTQRAFEDEDLGHGVFMHHVIEGLGGAADLSMDGNVSIPELNEYVTSRTYDYVVDRFGARQTPDFIGSIRGSRPLLELPMRPTLPMPELLMAPFSESRATAAKEAWAEYLDVDVDVENNIGMELTLIPPGEFLMGSTQSERGEVLRLWPGTDAAAMNDEHQHRVRLTQPNYVGVHEVTVGQFRRFIDEADYITEPERDGEGGWGWNSVTEWIEGRKPQYTWEHTGFTYEDDHPVVNVTWHDAIAFCNWLSRHEGFDEYYRVLNNGEQVSIRGGNGYRLLTEAEWEYACRAGTTTIWQHGNDPAGLANRGNLIDQTAKAAWDNYQGLTYLEARDGHVFTAPIGQFLANSFGLYDMHGNVDEWCWDGYDAEEFEARNGTTIDPIVSRATIYRVMRGGSWGFSMPWFSRSADRDMGPPDYLGAFLGFRVSRTP